LPCLHVLIDENRVPVGIRHSEAELLVERPRCRDVRDRRADGKRTGCKMSMPPSLPRNICLDQFGLPVDLPRVAVRRESRAAASAAEEGARKRALAPHGSHGGDGRCWSTWLRASDRRPRQQDARPWRTAVRGAGGRCCVVSRRSPEPPEESTQIERGGPQTVFPGTAPSPTPAPRDCPTAPADTAGTWPA
jgi:hypothetical protein